MPNTVTNEKIISATYVALFQRSPDQAGFKYWSDKAAELQLAGKTGNDLAKEMANLFAQHPAFTSLYGSLGDAAYIDAIYMNIGGKVADDNGRAFWLGKLTDATNPLSRAELVGEFVYTILSITPAELQAQKDAGSITEQELADALARQDRLNNKSDVALKFTQTMGVGSNLSPGTDPNSLESLQKDPVYLASKAIINGVTEDDATMTAPNTYLNGTPTITGINETFGGGTTDGKTFPLTAGADNLNGTAGADIFDGSQQLTTTNPTLNPFDTVNGGGGIDTIIVTQNVADANFNGVTSVERLMTNGTVTLGTQANRAGIIDVTNNGVDAVGASTDLTLAAGYAKDTLSVATSVSSVDSVIINNAAANTVFRTTFTSTEVGDGNIFDGSATSPQDGGLAVRLQKEDGADALVGGVSRFDDEGISFGSKDSTIRFDVRDISGTQYGTFAQATLGTSAADAALGANGDFAAVGTAGIYIDGGAGNDGIAGTVNADFLVGGTGDDTITSAGGNDSIQGGAGNDTINHTVGGVVNADGGAGDDLFVVTGQLQAVGLANTRDTITGGDGRDTLAANIGDLQGAAVPAAGETATISGIEVLRSVNAFAGTLTTKNVQTGIESVQFANNANTGTINFEAGARSVLLGLTGAANGATGQLGGNIEAVAAGTAADDALTVSNNVTAGAQNNFIGRNVTATGYESVTLTTGTVATAAQTAGTVAVNATTLTTPTTLTVSGANALTIASAATNSTGVFTVNATGLTAQPGNNPTFTVNVAVGATSGANVTGSAGIDSITLNAGNNTVDGGAGNDSIVAGAGKDNINAGVGNDIVVMGGNLTAADTVAGGDGRDTLTIGAAITAASQTGVSGFEILQIEGNANLDQNLSLLINNTGIDTVAFNTDNAKAHVITGGATAFAGLQFNNKAGDVTFTNLVNTTSNTLNVYAGADANIAIAKLTLQGIDGKASDGTDTLTISQGAANTTAGKVFAITELVAGDLDTLTITGAQNTTINTLTNGTGTARTTTINASASTGEVIIGNTANDSNVNYNFTGSASGKNTFTGSVGNDTITGGSNADLLLGAAGRDAIDGGAGVDTINGGASADVMTGGSGDDVFRLFGAAKDTYDIVAYADTNTTAANIDRITDFVGNGAAAGDTIEITTANLGFDPTAAAVVTVTAVSFAAADSFVQLAGLIDSAAGLAAANRTSDANDLRVGDVTIASGSLAGRYVVFFDNTAATTFNVNGADDLIVNITGVTGALHANDFALV